jgi:hypothetical protein
VTSLVCAPEIGTRFSPSLQTWGGVFFGTWGIPYMAISTPACELPDVLDDIPPPVPWSVRDIMSQAMKT